MRSYPVSCNEMIDPNPNPTNFVTSAPVCVKMIGHKTYKFRPVTAAKPLNYVTRNVPSVSFDANVIYQTVTNSGEELIESSVLGTNQYKPVAADFPMPVPTRNPV